MTLLQVQRLMTFGLAMVASGVIEWIPDPYDVRRRDSNRRTIPGDALARQNQPSSHWVRDDQPATFLLMPQTTARTGER